MRDQYIWKPGGQIKRVSFDSPEAMEFFKANDRIVCRDEVCGHLVSTVFLMIDHNFLGGDPILFETMIFSEGDSVLDEYQERYHTEDAARAGHARIVAMVKEKP